MTQACAPTLGSLLRACQVADRLCKGGVEHVEPVLQMRYLCHQLLLDILDVNQSRADEDLVAYFVKLLDAKDAHLELGDEVDPGECAVLPIPADEDDGAATLDAHHRFIAEVDRPADTGDELEEGAVGISHVVGGPGVDHPSRQVYSLPSFPICANTFSSTRCTTTHRKAAVNDEITDVGDLGIF
jgi:hypothetical protein